MRSNRSDDNHHQSSNMDNKSKCCRRSNYGIFSTRKVCMCHSSSSIHVCLLLLVVVVVWLSESSSTIVVVNAFPSSHARLVRHDVSSSFQKGIVRNQILVSSSSSSSSSLSAEKYGRGAAIFPVTNEKSFDLSDSFPNGIIPPSAVELLSQVGIPSTSTSTNAMDSSSNPDTAIPSSSLTTGEEQSASNIIKAASRGRKRKIIKGAISKILQGAAGAEEEALVGSSTSTIDAIMAAPISKSPIFIALSLMGLGLVHIVDIYTVVLMSAYMIILGILSNSPLSTSNLNSNSSSVVVDGGSNPIPALPSLPLQGHVPSLVSNPLGAIMTHSNIYRMWLRAGTVLGLIAPILTTIWYITRTFLANGGALLKETPLCNKLAAIACARPLFLLSCQAVTEAVSRRNLAPLPLRILIPVGYNTIRLGSLWQWTTTPTSLGVAGRILAASNLIYWSINLFAFLIPTATMRYLRAHFFCVEATEVQVREGGDNHVGLMS